jgi:hypothetical protein
MRVSRQQILLLWLAGPSLEAGVLGWTFYDGTAGAGPQLTGDRPTTGDQLTTTGDRPYATGLAALIDGWRLIQMSGLQPPIPGHERETSFLKHEFMFERIVELA